MLFATAWIDVLIPLVGGIVALFIPVRPRPPKLTEEKAKMMQRTLRICGIVLLGVALLYFCLMLGERGR